MKNIDLLTDCSTKPSPEMWEAIKGLDNTRLGDDVLRKDPTVNELEEKAARIMGKESALFVASGTMGNLVALLTHTNPGSEVLLEGQSHILHYEVGSMARIAGLMARSYLSEKGIVPVNILEGLIRPRGDIHQPETSLICLENTHNRHGGVILDVNFMKEVNELASNNGIPVHLDGARIFNAAVATNRPVSDYAKHADSVQFCLSKGLSCPIGSILVGSYEFIERARKNRKMLGGGWRQAGVIASMGLVALESKWINRLAEDHELARQLANGISNINPSIIVDEPETNILMVNFPKNTDMKKIIVSLHDGGVDAYSMGNKIRFVTRYGLNKEDIEYAIEKINMILTKIDLKS